MIKQLLFLLRISRAAFIARRYFVVNGFDGALTMLGLNVGFYVSGESSLQVIITACLGAAVALGVSGVSSAYVSEAAERERELRELERAMVRDMTDTAHGQASRLAPWLIGAVNGMAPFLFSLLIILPLWLAQAGWKMPLAAVEMALLVALLILFMLGIVIGRVQGSFWLWGGLRTLFIACVTVLLIYLLT
jgi:predicted membrane protein (TIGR00267 family)